ncbi:hypothetical protein COOONC_18852, partial [Cooperia oncophora]
MEKSYPGGPVPLPFVGNLLALYFYEPGYEAFRLWKEKYGRCFTFWMADRPAIVIADYELMKEPWSKMVLPIQGVRMYHFRRWCEVEIMEWLQQLVSYGNSNVGLPYMCSGILAWERMSCRSGFLGQRIQHDHTFYTVTTTTLNDDNLSSVLKMKSSTRSDNLTCVAVNPAGQVARSVSVQIRGPGSPPSTVTVQSERGGYTVSWLPPSHPNGNIT